LFDRSSLTRWRNRMGEERLQALLQESLSVATRTEAIKPSELSRVIVDTTVQPKNVTFPTDAKLLNRAREQLVRLVPRHGVGLRHSARPSRPPRSQSRRSRRVTGVIRLRQRP
jgi:transposase, IS5 family